MENSLDSYVLVGELQETKKWTWIPALTKPCTD